VGHRVVHGGDSFSAPSLITEEVKEQIRACIPLAPLHNPHNLEGIAISEILFPAAAQVAVFDTAFHQTIPEKARKYAIPLSFYNDQGIKVYGFHGTSHKYVSGKANEYLGRRDTNLITIHLGNGCSMSAVKNGKSIDHSLGFAPGNGLIMGSRSGDIDHALIFYLIKTLGYPPEEVERMLTRESGMLGLTGFSDLRDITQKAQEGDKACQLAMEMNAYRIRKYIGAYAAAMNGLDAIVFTAGIGENSVLMRQMTCEQMDYLGIRLDKAKNNKPSRELREVQLAGASVKVLVIPTNEELEIAEQTYSLLEQGN
jgi:acetate kinase